MRGLNLFCGFDIFVGNLLGGHRSSCVFWNDETVAGASWSATISLLVKNELSSAHFGNSGVYHIYLINTPWLFLCQLLCHLAIASKRCTQAQTPISDFEN